MGDEPILPIIQPVTIDTMLNWKTGRYFKVKKKNRAEFHYVWTLLNSKKNWRLIRVRVKWQGHYLVSQWGPGEPMETSLQEPD